MTKTCAGFNIKFIELVNWNSQKKFVYGPFGSSSHQHILIFCLNYG